MKRRKLMANQARSAGFMLLLLCLFVMSACSSDGNFLEDENAVSTDDIFADIRVTARGDGRTEVWARLRDASVLDEDDVYVYLENDYLRASLLGNLEDVEFEKDLFANTGEVASQIKRLQGEGDFRADEYSARFKGDHAGLEFTVSLIRGGNRVDAPDSRVVLPAQFDISSPLTGESYSHASDDIVVRWQPAGISRDMDLLVSGTCVDAQSFSLPIPLAQDSGEYILLAGFLDTDFPNISRSCNVTVQVSRSELGVLDPAYGFGGSIIARQQRLVRFTLTP